MIDALQPTTFAALALTVFFALQAVRMARDPEAPATIKFVFAGLPLIFGILAAIYLAADLGLLAA